MGCKCNLNGRTFVNFVASTGGSMTKIIDLTHYLCNGRRMCVTGSMAPTATITYTTKEITDVGNGSYFLTIGLSGLLSYAPVQSYSYCCASECNCPIVEPFYVEINVDYENADAPTYTEGIVVVTPIVNCCNQSTTNAVDIKTSVTITAPSSTTSNSRAIVQKVK